MIGVFELPKSCIDPSSLHTMGPMKTATALLGGTPQEADA